MSAAPTAAALRAVVIDDTADLRELMRLALTRGGFEVVGEAGDGRAGIETVRDQRPDLVLLDLSMPIMDGLEALPSIRQLVPHGKIVVLSGFGATQMSSRAMAAGADGYLQKGASLTAILDYVRDVTGGTTVQAPRPLSLVREPLPDPAPDAVARPSHEPSTQEALDLAPVGVLEVADEPALAVVHANRAAQLLLGNGCTTGTPLSTASPALAGLVAFHRLERDASFDVDLDGGAVRATLRHTGRSVLVYLEPTADDLSRLRRAIATAAHEIRGPVAVICGIADTIGWSGPDLGPEQRDRLLSSVVRQARMLDNITADLLTAAQIQRGTLRIDVRPVDPRAAVEAVAADRFEVAVEVLDGRSVRADPLRLEQMLTNLVGNAHKYGAPPYSVRVRPDGDLVALEVADRGPGVPEGFRDSLFREFARAEGTAASGTGLGLYVVRTLTEAQGGRVSYAPRPGGGSVFTVSLPAV